MKEGRHIILKNQSEIILSDDDEIVISIIADKQAKQLYHFACPIEGYGGGNLLISDSEKHLIFLYYSGQSEDAFVLFEICEDGLKSVYESGYLYGEGSDFLFLNNEKLLIQSIRTGWWSEVETDIDENGQAFYEFGRINIFDIMKKIVRTQIIYVYPADNWEEGVTDSGYLQMKTSNCHEISLKIIMPWGAEKDINLSEEIIVMKTENADLYDKIIDR